LNATVSSSTGNAVRITHMTGPSTDLGVQLATAWYLDGEARSLALASAQLRAAKIFCFAVGAAAMLPLVNAFGHLAFVAPGCLVLVATVRSFLPHRNTAPRAFASASV
jgi:uncharacterized membrane protein YoaK (UPF0700 family)